MLELFRHTLESSPILALFLVVGAGYALGRVNARIAPVAAEGFTLRDANAPKVLQGAQAVYTAVCATCHASGLAGAPKITDTAAWGPRIQQGYDTLLKHAIEAARAKATRAAKAVVVEL